MRGLLIALGAVMSMLVACAVPAGAQSAPSPEQKLTSALNRQYVQLGRYSGASVVDLSTGKSLFASATGIGRLPASVQKLYTTSTALLRFGPQASLSTEVFGRGTLSKSGTWTGTLYLRGGGDPTFGSAAFDRTAYGGGTTVHQLVASLARMGIKAIEGRVLGDESYFDSLRGTIASGYAFNPYMEGSLSALAFNRGLTSDGASAIPHPAAYAAQQLVYALRAAGVNVPRGIPTGSATTPSGSRLLTTVHSPSMATLIAWTNTPSDNFFAEMLLKGLGARFGAGGTTAAGVAVVRSLLAYRFGLHPAFFDGSGLSRADSTSPQQVVNLLRRMAANQSFVNSLAVAGETGTLANEMRGTPAQGRCRGKTGTLSDVASLAGYCQAADGHMLAFAILANGLGNPNLGHALEANMAVALANYDG